MTIAPPRRQSWTVTAILGGGLLVVALLWWTRPTPEITARPERAEPVDVISVTQVEVAPLIHAQGSVVPERAVTLQAQVGGRVVARHPALITGGVVEEGDVLLRIEASDYDIALQEAANQVERARADLLMEEGRQVVARQEWERYGNRGEPSPLALREPQRRQAELEIQRGEQAVARARLQRERTTLRAPFRALVTEAGVEVGQLVSSSTPVATLVDVQAFRVAASISLEDLAHIAIPGRDGAAGSPVRILSRWGDQVVEHAGEVERLMGELDAAGRMARVLIRVPDPYLLPVEDVPPESTPAGPLLQERPLLLGSFVSAEIQGLRRQPVVLVPRAAVFDGNHIHVATAEDRLERRTLRAAWRTPEVMAVVEGLETGDRVVTTRLTAPIEGLRLLVRSDQSAPWTGASAPLPPATLPGTLEPGSPEEERAIEDVGAGAEQQPASEAGAP